MKNETNVNGQYKDRLFNFIFGREENREWTLSLYNAVNGSSYTDASLIKFNTLENVIYISMANDTSFLISGTVNVYEHQSTYNPNMPYRFLDYLNKLYSGYITDNKLNQYGSKLMKLPTPKLIVFYNGIDDKDEESILKLSDSYIKPVDGEPDIDIRVRMINVNYGKNKKIMDACKPLSEYSWLIDKIREYQRAGMKLDESVDEAVKVMSSDYLIKPFLIKNRAEVKGMLSTEYNEAEIRELFMEDGRAEERENTAREKARADNAEARADAAEEEIRKLQEELAKLRAKLSQ